MGEVNLDNGPRAAFQTRVDVQNLEAISGIFTAFVLVRLQRSARLDPGSVLGGQSEDRLYPFADLLRPFYRQ